jgi:hypothetical protein
VQFLVKDKSGQDMKFNYSPAPQGQLKFRLQVFLGMKSECGIVVGSYIEDFTRLLIKLPATSAFIHQNCMVAERSTPKAASNAIFNLTTKALPHDGASSNSGGSASSVVAVSPTQDIKLPLLQAPADAASVSAHGSKKKLWIAIVEGYLFIYQCYGGPFRLTLSISQFDYSIQPCHQGAVFSLHKFGYPSFHFQTLEKTDFFRWKCALICNIRYLVDPQAEFNTEQLIQDIVKVNAVYMPQPAKTPKVGSKGKGGKLRMSKSVHDSKVSELAGKPLLTAANVSASDIEDSMVGLRYSEKKKIHTKPTKVSRRSQLLSSVLATSVLDDESTATASRHDVNKNDCVDKEGVRTSLSALDVLDEDTTGENLCNNSYVRVAECLAGLIYSKDIDVKLKV